MDAMSPVIPFRPDRFRTAAAHYAEGRPAYAPRLIARVAERLGLDGRQRVLDLGCGPGPLALAFTPVAAEVVAVDPEPAMLAIAQAAAQRAGCAITFVEGSSYDLGPRFGRFRLAAIGRAFHWMDRADTLTRLDGLIEPEGAMALFHDDHPALPDNDWCEPYRALLDRYTEPDDHHELRKSGRWVRHEAVLLESPFSSLETVAVTERRRTPVDRLVDRAFSMSTTSPQRLGDKVADLARELRGLLEGIAVDGAVTEVVRSEALIASRPAAG